MSPECRRRFATDLKPVRLVEMTSEIVFGEWPPASDALLMGRRVAATSSRSEENRRVL